MDKLYKMGDYTTGDLLLQHMRDIGIRPTVYTFNALLTRYAQTFHRDVCEKIYEQMIASGVAPDATSYDIMLHVYYARPNKYEKYKELFEYVIQLELEVC